ncbi:MAG: hypothetical protein AAF630_00065 [Cyanobacteria bacterium P01_C01_bin.38]
MGVVENNIGIVEKTRALLVIAPPMHGQLARVKTLIQQASHSQHGR